MPIARFHTKLKYRNRAISIIRSACFVVSADLVSLRRCCLFQPRFLNSKMRKSHNLHIMLATACLIAIPVAAQENEIFLRCVDQATGKSSSFRVHVDPHVRDVEHWDEKEGQYIPSTEGELRHAEIKISPAQILKRWGSLDVDGQPSNFIEIDRVTGKFQARSDKKTFHGTCSSTSQEKVKNIF